MYDEKSEMESKQKARTKHNHKLNVKTLRETAKFVLMFVNRMINYFLAMEQRLYLSLLLIYKPHTIATVFMYDFF